MTLERVILGLSGLLFCVSMVVCWQAWRFGRLEYHQHEAFLLGMSAVQQHLSCMLRTGRGHLMNPALLRRWYQQRKQFQEELSCEELFLLEYEVQPPRYEDI